MIGKYEQLKADIAEVIRENGRQEITGDILQQVLLGMVGELGGGATFAGIAEPQPSVEALTPDNDVFYLAFDKGVYGQFGGLTVDNYGLLNVVYIKDGEWTLKTYGEQEVRVTYGELKTLLQSARLTSGKVYRITDYETVLSSDITTAQSAGHVFDVLVTAVAENELSEDARAIHHDGDTYFQDARLEAWQLKYRLDNVQWSKQDGRGTITWMKDEHGNECPYDFKNVQFKRYKATDSVSGRDGLGGKYMVAIPSNCPRGLSVVDTDDFIWAYTFSSDNAGGKQTDYSLTAEHQVHDNVMKAYSGGLPNNVMFGRNNYSNSFGFDCYNNSWGNNCYNNSWGNNCGNNSWGNNCGGNSWGNNCGNNSWGKYCSGNSWGNNCGGNSWGNVCQYNSWGNYCSSNSWGNNCGGNSWGNNCGNNSWGNGCQHNSWGNKCYNNSWGNYCSSNSLGNSCLHNAWEGVQYSTIGNGIEYTVIESAVGYVQILDGVSGRSGSPVTIPFAAGTDAQCAGMIGGAVKVWKPAERGLAVVEIEGATTYTLNAEVGKYYRFDQAEALNLVLPVPDANEVASVVLGVPFSGGASLTVTSEADVRYQDGFAIKEMTNYEINCLWNGLRWVVAAMNIAEA